MSLKIFLVASCIISMVVQPLFFCQTVTNDSQNSLRYCHSVSAAIGLNDFHAKDDYLSPYIFKGIMFSSEISYEIRSDDIIHFIALQYSSGKPDTHTLQREISEFTGKLSYSFLFRLHTLNLNNQPFQISSNHQVQYRFYV